MTRSTVAVAAGALGAVLLGGLPSAARSAPDDFCAALTQVANEAQDGFRKFRAGSDGLGDYASNLTLPGASECYIEREDADFICRWRLSFSQDANTEAKRFADGIQQCYPKARASTSRVTRVAKYVYKLNGVSFNVGVDEKRNTVLLFISRDK